MNLLYINLTLIQQMTFWSPAADNRTGNHGRRPSPLPPLSLQCADLFFSFFKNFEIRFHVLILFFYQQIIRFGTHQDIGLQHENHDLAGRAVNLFS
ncbi:putative protein STRUBBELIG-RECEPTOR FAMILY 7 isoform X6 [Iris pallida]|uniref:Uncharacterized protein n=1 Tax=Iris pallida TaxID=29817 RepID=A0AAX6I9J4_IRIPA|nr:putative protein STRUBBELIG-RECEPTOR FAMILY 7 isoform X6 [Iris pallida]